MNLILLEAADFASDGHVRLSGRRLEHVRRIHAAAVGDELRVGVVNGRIGRGRVVRIDDSALEMTVVLDSDPPAPLPVRLILALPRPKVLNRTIAAAASMGIREIDLINSWRVEKSYWKSPRLSPENLRAQCLLGLEQGFDTMLPAIRTHRLFAPFVRELQLHGALGFVAHPRSKTPLPRGVTSAIVLAIGPEGGFIDREVETFHDVGFQSVSLGPRILRVETALAYLLGRLS